MKKIEAIVKSFKLEDVTDALGQIGVSGVTITPVKIYDKTHGCKCSSCASGHTDPIPRHKIELVVPDSLMEGAVRAVQLGAQTDCIKNGDGEMHIYHVDSAIRIRTEEVGEVAIS